MRERPRHAPAPPSRLWYLLAGALILAVTLVAAAALSSGSAQALAQATPPSNGSLPTISGSAALGQTLTASSGSWSGDPTITFGYQWRRCNSSGASCSDIPGATGSTRTVDSDDVGFTLRVQVTATNGAGSGVAQSNATSVVTASSAPVNTAEPTVSGSAVQGQTLTGTTGSWAGATPITYSYQWVRCGTDGGASDGSNCPNVSGATGASYVLQSDDVGHRMRLRVTATNGGGAQTAASNATLTIAAAPSGKAPKNAKEPTISGTAKQGQTLTANVGTWSGATPIGYAYQWLRCDRNGNNCIVLTGQNKSTYVLSASEVNARVRVRVTGSNKLGSATATSNATAVVQASTTTTPPPTTGTLPPGAIKLPNGKYSIPITSVSLPNRLIIDSIQFTPNPVRSRQTTIQLRVHVVDTRGYVVRDALVFGRSTPILTTSMANRPTGQDGWVTLSLAPEPDFPLKNGHNVQFFVRARKAGDNVLAGVSTRRLVQVRTATR
jgi:hypothetical protein